MRKLMIPLAVISGSLLVAACSKAPEATPEANNVTTTVETNNTMVEDTNMTTNTAPAMGNDSAGGNAANTATTNTGEAETAGSNGGPGLKPH
jgi:outer membrane murein-binding lipoprotein Lpp